MSLFLACFFLLIPFSISVGLTPEVRESTNINNFPTSALLTNLSNMTRRGGWKSESEKGKEEKGAEVGGGEQDRDRGGFRGNRSREGGGGGGEEEEVQHVH